MKYSVISSFLGKSKDRFNEYNEPRTLEEKFAIASTIEGISALECVYPYEVNDPKETKALMEKYHLGISAINVNVKAEPEFLNGGLTNADKKVRDKAVRFIKQAKDFAAEIGADKVTCCPLGDGYEFAFQADYAENWNRLKETFSNAAAYKPEIMLFIEFKPSEIRGKCFLDTTAKTILLIKEIGRKGIGVTMDYGHAIYGGCNPAEEISLCHSCGIPYYVHINDNDAKWDWDYFCGSKHIVENLEFVYYLKKYGYNDYLTSDTSPTRWDMVKVFKTNNRFTDKMDRIVKTMEADGFENVITGKNFMDVWEFVENHLVK
ncbi:MAG: sugar phosphate isomerase/epimerase family protein [Sphaerochaetaceae bacterium]|jgi:xylose isomerase